MNDKRKTKEQLLGELVEMRQRLAKLETSGTECKRAEEELRESQARLRDLYESAPSAYFSVGVDGLIRRCNRRAGELLGYAVEEMMGRPVFELYADAPQGKEKALKVLRRFQAGETVIGEELQMQKADGTPVWTSLAVNVVRDARGQVVESRLVVMDITKRKQTEEALRRRNSELAFLNQAGQTLNSTLDLDQVLVIVLEKVRRLLGVVACSIWLTDPETNELVCQQSSGPQSEIVRGWRLASGEGLAGWVAHSGRSLIVPDVQIDERHFAGVDRQTGLGLRSILSVPLYTKNAVIGVLQVTDTEVDRFSPTDLTLLEPMAASAATAIDNARLVETLRQRNTELQARNEELDAFAHTVAHDLKGPLAPIVGYAETLVMDYATNIDQGGLRRLHKIAQNGRKMGRIIDELLLLAGVRKMGEAEMRPLDMASIVAEAQDRLAQMIEEHQAEIILPDTWPVALGHAPWVEEVWVNYLDNAINYGGQPPRVELGATTQPDGTVSFWIRDNGLGLTPEEQARLFTPFTRFDKGGRGGVKGHGLGLSIVRRIMEKLGGQVGVESKVGQGSVFSFTLPGVASQNSSR